MMYQKPCPGSASIPKPGTTRLTDARGKPSGPRAECSKCGRIVSLTSWDLLRTHVARMGKHS